MFNRAAAANLAASWKNPSTAPVRRDPWHPAPADRGWSRPRRKTKLRGRPLPYAGAARQTREIRLQPDSYRRDNLARKPAARIRIHHGAAESALGDSLHTPSLAYEN